jgi:hypothetical protein
LIRCDVVEDVLGQDAEAGEIAEDRQEGGVGRAERELNR